MSELGAGSGGAGSVEGSAGEFGGGSGEPRRRRRERHRKRRKPQIVVPSWRWWHLLAAIGVAMIGGAFTILMLRGNGPP